MECTKKKFVLILLNIILITFLATNLISADIPVPENSLFWDARLSDLTVTSDDSKIIYDIQGTGSIYLIKSDTEVLSNAEVTFKVPALNYSGVMVEESPGIYTVPIFESILITPEMSAQGVGTSLFTIPTDLKLNDNKIQNTSISDYLSNIDMTTQSSETYEIPLKLLIQGKVLADNSPLSNKNLIYSLPKHDYSNTVQTSTDGTATVLLDEIILVTVSGGNIVTLDHPIQMPSDSDVVAFWGGGGGGGCTANSLSVSVTTDRSQYVQNEIIRISGRVKDNCGNYINNAQVKITIKEDGWFGWFGETYKPFYVFTGSDGSYSHESQIPNEAKSGKYKVEVYATKSGLSAGSSSTNFWVIDQPKIMEITYDKYLDKYKNKGNNIVFNRGDTLRTTVWLDGDVVEDKHNIILDITNPGSCNENFVKWTTKSAWWDLLGIFTTYHGAVFDVEIPDGNPVGNYEIDAKLYYDSNTGQRDLSGADGGTLTSNFYVIFDTSMAEADKECYVYGNGKDETAIYFNALETRSGGRWMGKDEALARGIQPFTDSKFKLAIGEIQGETSEQNAIVKLMEKVPSQLSSSNSLHYAALMTELSRSAGIPARIATIDANEGQTGRSCLQVTEVYINGEWQVVDALNNVGPMTRRQMGTNPDYPGYNEENNDDIFIAEPDWDSWYVDDWWRGPLW